MSHAENITVTKRGEKVFSATSGRLGVADSADRDFCCFASPIIGAAYVVVDQAAKRISSMGFTTTIVRRGIEVVFQAQT